MVAHGNVRALDEQTQKIMVAHGNVGGIVWNATKIMVAHGNVGALDEKLEKLWWHMVM